MKVSLNFDMPDEKEEFFLCINAHNYAIAFEDLDQYLRRIHKYNGTDFISIIEDEYPEVRQDSKMVEILEHLAFKLRGEISRIKEEAGVSE
ncbi:MAG TPA: hypothetical protein PKI14_01575 [Fervidobacterium sp.]|nr:hypothetical protein [Fervidobacterium sp.]